MSWVISVGSFNSNCFFVMSTEETMKNSSPLFVLLVALLDWAASEKTQLTTVANTIATTRKRLPTGCLRVPKILLIPQRLDRIEMRSLIRRIKSKKHAHGSREDHGDEKSFHRNAGRPSQRAGNRHRTGYPDDHPQGSSHQAK